MTPNPLTAGRRPRPTIRDVADAAGVSLKTVSRVLNAESGVAPATASRVNEAASALGFRRNESASRLRRGDPSTHIVALVIEDLANPFYSALARSIEQVVSQRGYLLVLASSDENPEKEKEVLLALCARQVDGLIVVPTGRELGYLEPEVEAGTHVVYVDRPRTQAYADSVTSANEEGAAQATRHLLDHGHRRIAYLGDLVAIDSARERHAGFRAAMKAAGVKIDPKLVRLEVHDTQTASDVTTELLCRKDPPTAIFCGNNLATTGALWALSNHPSKVALIGFDDFEFATVVDPPVTVVTQDVAGLGKKAAEILLSRIDGDLAPRRREVLPVELLVRGSAEISPS